MPQKSILSFFNNPANGQKSDNTVISPSEVVKPKRRRLVADSSSDSDSTDTRVAETCSIQSNYQKENKLPVVETVTPVNVIVRREQITVKHIDIEDRHSPGKTDLVDEGCSAQNKPPSPTHIKRISQDYDPSKEDYHPIADSIWRKGDSVPYLALAKTFEYIELTSGRLKIINALCNLFRSVGLLSPTDLPTCIHLCLNRFGPAYEGTELGIGETVLLKALGMTTGVSLDHLKNTLKKQGDLGTLAETTRSRQKTMFTPKPLTVSQVFSKLKEVAGMSGNAAQSKKVERICTLLVACRESESKYLIRSLSGKLRIGLAEQSVLTALGQAAAYTPFHSAASVLQGSNDASACDSDAISRLLNASVGLSPEHWKIRVDECVAQVKKAYCVYPDYEKLVAGLMADGPYGLHHHCFITPGVPVKPMLAHPTHGVKDVLKRFDAADFSCEYKYDGERAQIHMLPGGSVHVYSRNQEDNTTKYPDIVSGLMPRVINRATISNEAKELVATVDSSASCDVDSLESCILDSEVVAWDRQAGHILPFQILSTRKRKDVGESDVKVNVCVYAFDLLYVNGVSLIEQPFRRRREILRKVFPSFEGEFMLATSLDSADTEEIALFLEESIKGNCEGLMVKTLDKDSTYEIAKRSHNWLKLKKDYLDNVGDTLDLIVLGGFHGTGKRAGRYGGFLLACYDTESEEMQTVCKIGTGMKDDDLVTFSDMFKDKVIEQPKPYYQYSASLVPDHWFEPAYVWEVKAADLSISPVHKAAVGLADPEKGISLRFPRFLRIRDDKRPEDATSAQQIYEIYKNQEQIKTQETGTTTLNEEDMY